MISMRIIIMRHRILIQTALIFFFSTLSLYAQYVPGVTWFKIETEHFKVIFPSEITEEAVLVAQKAEEIYRREVLDYHVSKEQLWPLILTTSGMNSNGYVSLAPRRSVWFGTPSGEGMSALSWYDLLGLHEIRHMVQMDSLNKRFIKVLYLIGGELGLTAGVHLSVPSWFLEGDAVSAETMYSDGGRGRDPLFFCQMKILTINENFSYQKYVNRSYKDYIPNQYVFGYFMTAYIRKKYGDDSWNRILNTATLVPLPAFGIYLGAKKVTGKSWSSLFDEMMEELKKQWIRENRLVEIIPNHSLFESLRDNYSRYETIYSDGQSVLARKTSLAEPSVLVRISEGREEILCRISSEGSVTSNGKSVVWSYLKPSVLHQSQSWSDLAALDLETKHKTILTRKTRLLYPVFSPDGRSLAVVHWSTSRKSEIQILEAGSWTLLKNYPLPDNSFPARPSWSEDGRNLYFTLQGSQGRSIVSLLLESGSLSVIKGPTMDTVKRVFPWRNYILYSSGATGVENIMALDVDSRKKYQVSSRLFGVEFPYLSISDSRVYYSEILDHRGSAVAYQELNPQKWKLLVDDPVVFEPYSGRGSWSVHALDIGSGDDDPLPVVEKYSLWEDRINIHSWGISPNLETMTGLRFQVQSTDLMGTMNMAAGSEYELNEKTWGAFFDMDWKQFYPVLNLRNSMSFRTLGDVDLWDGSFRAGFSFPMKFKRDVWFFSLNPRISTGLRAYLPVDGSKSLYYFPIDTGITGYALLPGSFRSINPDWGIIQRDGISMDPERSGQFYRVFTDSRIYLPGLFRNCSLTLNGAFEEQSGQYALSFPFARGYDSGTEFRTFKGSVDYDFPLIYPDLAIGSFFYISRIRGKFFYDSIYQENRTDVLSRFQSAGAEILFDMTAANQVQGPFSLALRYSWLLEEGRSVFQFIFINATL